MALGEIFLATFLQVLFSRLASLELLKFASLVGIQKKLQKWAQMLSAIQAVLEDAEEKQLTDKAVKLWLDNLRDLAYDVEDMLDEFAVEAMRCKLKGSDEASKNQVQKLVPACCNIYRAKAVKFSLRMGSKMDRITSRLADILKQKIQLGLEKIPGGQSTNQWQRLPSTSVPTETQVYGRGEDKEKMLDWLLRDESNDVNFQVISIVGMGGVGKTTLAQLLYNDDAVGHFNPKAWVCVSEEFDVLRITRTILESATSLPCDLKDFNQIQVKLRDALAGRKFLIVLDDVWNKNYSEWNRLQPPFRVGAPGSKIIVTTRDSNVALLMGTTKIHCLEQMSNDDCWSVFAQHAFENKDLTAQPNLEIIGRKIVKKCKGLPLAARTLGGLLRCKERDCEWEDILNSDLWSLSDEESEILPVLRLSYHHLPSQLKRCFSFCSVLPKDYEFEEKELVLLWMAEGLVQQPEENKQIEDVGGEYFCELLSRSLFQRSSRDQSKFVMHDLISDLAQWVAGDVSFTLEDKVDGNKMKISPKARYSSYICGQYDDLKKFEPFSDAKGLRTFLPFSPPYPGKSYLTSYVPSDLLPKLRCLRILSLSGYNITELPNSIGKLKHLRHLNLSHTNIRNIPESASSLHSLQTLLLRDCTLLKNLPAKMGNLINLRHLDITNGESIEGMPLGMNKLTNLQTLSDFVVGNDKGSSLKELMELSFLRGTLCISKLENVADASDAREANLKNKQGLDMLLLKWCSGFDNSRNERVENNVLDMLQPPTKLKELTIQCYGGTKFPIWLGDPSFREVVSIRLEKCENCTSLPPLGLLASLKDLSIIGMSGIKSIGAEFYGGKCSKPFPSLQILCFQDMREWELWVPYGTDNEEFPSLRDLWIENCPKLTGRLPNYLSSLEKLVILECEKLVVSIPSIPMLSKLQIKGCKEVAHGGLVNFSSPNSMVVSTISELTCLTEEFIQVLKNVEDLKVFGCKGLISLWQNDIKSRQWLTFLHNLVIEDCPKLVSLVAEEDEEQLQQSWGCELQSLEIRRCESLVMLPQFLHSLISLRELVIESCPRFISFPEAGLPPMLRGIRIKNCSALGPLPAAVIWNSACLENLYIEGCCSLMPFARSQLPSTLKRIEIRSCKNLQYLFSDGESSSSFSSSVMNEQDIDRAILELHICDCPLLLSLSSRGELPAALIHMHIKNCSELNSLVGGATLPAKLKHLHIEDCPKLESIGERFEDEMCLETIYIFSCERLNSLPEGINNLTHLHEISIWYCPGLVLFPGELPTANLRELCISWCEELKALPDSLHNLTSLQELWIYDCPNIASFPEEGFPTKLTSLTITNLNICKPLFEWGLQRLNSLKDLYIEGGCFEVLSFPQDETRMMLPTSLRSLSIIKFPNLRYLSSRGFHTLTSLEYLSLSYCHKLTSFPKEGLPSSLLQLYIYCCPLLKKNCEKNKGREWFKIANVPCVRIDGRFIHEQQS